MCRPCGAGCCRPGYGVGPRKRREHRKWRERKEHVGELVQMDRGFHDWLEGRGPLVRTTEDERANTDQSNRQPGEDFQVGEKPEFADAQLSPGEQGKNQEQVHDRGIDVGRGRLEGVRQNRQNGGRLPQGLEAEHPAKDPLPYQDANAPAPTDHCNGAGCRSDSQENRSQDDIDHVAAERCCFH